MNISINTIRGWIAVAMTILGLVWMAASWYGGVNDHLSTIDLRLKHEDEKLDWLVQHNPSAAQAPQSWLNPPNSGQSASTQTYAYATDAILRRH